MLPHIDISDYNRIELCVIVQELLASINKIYFKTNYHVLWRGTPTCVEESKHLFDFSISDEEFFNINPKINDVNVLIPNEKLVLACNTFSYEEGVQLTDDLYCDTKNESKICFSFLYKAHKFNVKFIAVDFQNDVPTCFSKFIHHSDWLDYKVGIATMAHKCLVMALVSSLKEDYHFSIDKGLCNETNSKIECDNDISSIFSRIFEQFDSNDVSFTWSFHGLLELCERYLTDKQITDVYDNFIYFLDNHEEFCVTDNQKNKMINMMIKAFPYLHF